MGRLNIHGFLGYERIDTCSLPSAALQRGCFQLIYISIFRWGYLRHTPSHHFFKAKIIITFLLYIRRYTQNEDKKEYSKMFLIKHQICQQKLLLNYFLLGAFYDMQTPICQVHGWMVEMKSRPLAALLRTQYQMKKETTVGQILTVNSVMMVVLPSTFLATLHSSLLVAATLFVSATENHIPHLGVILQLKEIYFYCAFTN